MKLVSSFIAGVEDKEKKSFAIYWPLVAKSTHKKPSRIPLDPLLQVDLFESQISSGFCFVKTSDSRPDTLHWERPHTNCWVKVS